MIGGEEEEFVTVSQEIKSRKLELSVDFCKELPAKRTKTQKPPSII